MIMEKKNEVENYSFNLTEPVDEVFNLIEDLAELVELAGRPYSDEQLTDFGFVIFNRRRALREDIRTWLRKSNEKKTTPI